MKTKRKFLALLLAIVTTLSSVMPVFASNSKGSMKNDVKVVLDETTAYLLENVKEPQFGTIGGEWVIFGLARRDAQVPKNYYENYYKKVASIAKEEHEKKSRNWKTKITETQRLAIATTAVGKDATNINGVNLIDYSFNKAKNMSSLSEKDRVLGSRQGINELVFGLLTMNLKLTKTPKDATITQDEIITKIINDYTTKDGGFNLTAHHDKTDVDMTAMVIQALAPYYKNPDYPNVTQTVDKALKRLSEVQNKSGGFNNPSPTSNSKDPVSLESTAQVIVALCSLGIDPTTDKRFMKNGNNPITDLMAYAVKGGGFEHIKGQGINQMATEQGYYALVAYERFVQGKSAIYDMRDVK